MQDVVQSKPKLLLARLLQLLMFLVIADDQHYCFVNLVRAFLSLLQFSCVPFVRMICVFLTNNQGPIVPSKRSSLLPNMENRTVVLQNKVNSVLLCVTHRKIS